VGACGGAWTPSAPLRFLPPFIVDNIMRIRDLNPYCARYGCYFHPKDIESMRKCRGACKALRWDAEDDDEDAELEPPDPGQPGMVSPFWPRRRWKD